MQLFGQPTVKNFSLLFFLALFVRLGVFCLYIQHGSRYQQADSLDYHNCAVLLTHTQSMTRPDTKEPIFWRTPGYPVFLKPFYQWSGVGGAKFRDYATAHKAALVAQIILTSCIPIVLFFLAMVLTANLFIAWIMAYIAALHVGFVLASSYLLTDALASFFFFLFMLFFYRSFFLPEKKKSKENWLLDLCIAAICLSIYTWMRPMGKFIGLFAGVMLLFCATQRFKKSCLFIALFFLTLAPWYIRNLRLTGKLFFCPMLGAYLQSFCAPKILRRLTGASFEECWKTVALQTISAAKQQKTSIYFVAGSTAWPLIKAHPFYFAYDWIVQVFKTAFDLYSYQLVALARNCFFYDPMEEWLLEKIAACLCAGPLPVWMRLIAWLELFFMLFLWIGIFGALIFFGIVPLYKKIELNKALPQSFFMLCKTVPLCVAIIFMTGGFGYARLRLPIEPLMIIIALTFWAAMKKKYATVQPTPHRQGK